MELDPQAIEAGARVVVHDSIGSTNAEALARARAGEPDALWVVARRQTAGRGRRGRSWHSPAGNLYASLLLIDPAPPERAAQLSFVAALAAHDAVAERAPDLAAALRFKWPNDLLLAGKKLAGILVEGETLPDGRFAVAVGIGVNCRHHPADTPDPATDLSAAGAEVSPEALLRALSVSMWRRIGGWDRGANFSAIRNAWLIRAEKLGEPISLAPDGIAGVFDGLDDEGRLLLRREGGIVQAYAAAEVRFPAAGSQPESAA